MARLIEHFIHTVYVQTFIETPEIVKQPKKVYIYLCSRLVYSISWYCLHCLTFGNFSHISTFGIKISNGPGVARAVLQRPWSLIYLFIHLFIHSSKYHKSITIRARELTLWECSPTTTCHVSGVTCHMSHVMCQMSFYFSFFFYEVVNLIDWGSVIHGAYPV